jgi:hypothetical protein
LILLFLLESSFFFSQLFLQNKKANKYFVNLKLLLFAPSQSEEAKVNAFAKRSAS